MSEKRLRKKKYTVECDKCPWTYEGYERKRVYVALNIHKQKFCEADKQ